MDTRQIIYPTERLLANPRVFMAIAREFDGPDWETIANAFYDLIEHDILQEEEMEDVAFNAPEVCFREKPGAPEVMQIVLPDGNAVELHPTASSADGEEEYYAAVKTEEDFAITSTINARLIRAIEEAAPEVAGDVALCEPPTPANEFLRDSEDDCFRGQFHLMSDPDRLFDFRVEVVDLSTDQLRASVRPIK
jgi:hypothetical protein